MWSRIMGGSVRPIHDPVPPVRDLHPSAGADDVVSVIRWETVMSEPGSGSVPEPAAWNTPGPAVRHSYGLTVRDHGLGTACGLLIRTMPYAFARFGILLAYAVGCIIWMIVAFGGAAWFGTHVAGAFG